MTGYFLELDFQQVHLCLFIHSSNFLVLVLSNIAFLSIFRLPLLAPSLLFINMLKSFSFLKVFSSTLPLPVAAARFQSFTLSPILLLKVPFTPQSCVWPLPTTLAMELQGLNYLITSFQSPISKS